MRIRKETIENIRETEKDGYEAAVFLRELVLGFSGKMFRVDGCKTKKFAAHLEPFTEKYSYSNTSRYFISNYQRNEGDLCRLRVSRTISGDRWNADHCIDFYITTTEEVEKPDKVLTFEEYKKLHKEAGELEVQARQKLDDYRVFGGQTSNNHYFD